MRKPILIVMASSRELNGVKVLFEYTFKSKSKSIIFLISLDF